MQTTAHTLCFTFALLALYPKIQEQLLEHIHGVVAVGTQPVSLELQSHGHRFNDSKDIRSNATTRFCDGVSG